MKRGDAVKLVVRFGERTSDTCGPGTMWVMAADGVVAEGMTDCMWYDAASAQFKTQLLPTEMLEQIVWPA